jgi:MarR family multiple antibiotic resistance transcriptional regulator
LTAERCAVVIWFSLVDSARVYAVATKIHAGASNLGTASQFFDDLVRCETRLYNELNDRLREQHGIVASQFEFLRFLRDHPESRVADVAAMFAAGVGAISKGADRLEGSGWVRRVANPSDGRSSLLALTPLGAELVADAERTFNRCLEELVSDVLDEAQLTAAVDALSVLRQKLEHDRIGVPVG